MWALPQDPHQPLQLFGGTARGGDGRTEHGAQGELPRPSALGAQSGRCRQNPHGGQGWGLPGACLHSPESPAWLSERQAPGRCPPPVVSHRPLCLHPSQLYVFSTISKMGLEATVGESVRLFFVHTCVLSTQPDETR